MSTSPCSSANIPPNATATNDLLYGDGNNKFVPSAINTSTCNYLKTNNISSPQVEITSTHQSTTLKQFLAQKYAAESTSDGDRESSHSNNNQLPNQSFPNAISNYYPFSPLVSSSSHFDTRNILPEGILESSIDSLQVESSTNEQVSGHTIFNGLSTIGNFIKEDVSINLPPTSTPNVTSSSTRPVTSEPNNQCRVEIVPSSLFDTVNSDITVDSTTTISISQPSIINQSLASLSFTNYSTLNQLSTVSYGLSTNLSNTLLHENPIQLSSPTIQMEQYYNQTNIDKKENNLNQQHLLPSSIHPFTNDNCLISDNSLSEQLFHGIPNENYETENVNLQENIINDLPVLTRARASLPIDYLYFQEAETTLGVFARKVIPKRTQFGPIEGVIASLPGNQYSPNHIANDSKNNLIIFISYNLLLTQVDENNSNWTRFVRPARNSAEQNLELITKEYEPMNEVKFYFYTTKNIMPNEELKVWYSNEYARTFGIKLLEEAEANKKNFLENSTNSSTVAANSNAPATATVTIINNNNAEQCGHKLRNKIAKTQNAQLVKEKEDQETSCSANKVIGQETLNTNPMNDLFNNTRIELVSTESAINEIVDNDKKPIQTTEVIKNNVTTKRQESITNETNNNNNTVNGKQKYQCDQCQKEFPRQYSLQRHLVMHSGEKRYKCPICGTAFNHVYNRNRHIKMHKAANKSDEQIIILNENVATQTPKDNLIINSNINEQTIAYEEVNNLAPEIKLEQESVIERAIDSTLSVNKEVNISELVTSTELDKNKTLTANTTTTSTTITALNKSNKNSTERRYRCTQCYKRFLTSERLERHRIVHDESAKKLSCGVCHRKFLTNSALSCHVKYHKFSPDEPRKYDCTLCDKIFDTIQKRREHVSVHINPDTGLFHCPKCPKTFEDFSIIRKHLKSFHSDEIFPCTQCTKVFPRQDKLRLHMLCHIDRWEFKCNFCEKQFKRKDKLKEHTQRMHAPDRDLRIAAKMAARLQRSKVQRVKKVATKPIQPNYEEYVYKCYLCLFGFKRRGMLVNHLAKRHPEVPYNTVPELNMPIVKTSKDYYCQYCEKVYKSSSKRKAHIIKNHPGKSLPPSNRCKTVTSDAANQSFSTAVGSIVIDPHFCDWCHKQYASKAKLMQHQRKKHAEELEQVFSTKSLNNRNNNNNNKINGNNTNNSINDTNTLPPTLTAASTTNDSTNLFKFDEIKEEIDSDNQILENDPTKIDHFLSDNSPAFIDSFNITNYIKDNGTFLNGNLTQTQEPIHYTIDSTNPTFEDLMSMTDVNHNLNAAVNSNPFANNVITILTCTNSSGGATTFTGDLSDFSDIITQITDFQSAKQQILSTNTGITHESTSNDLLISGSIEDNTWNQVCEEMAIV